MSEREKVERKRRTLELYPEKYYWFLRDVICFLIMDPKGSMSAARAPRESGKLESGRGRDVETSGGCGGGITITDCFGLFMRGWYSGGGRMDSDDGFN